MGQSALAHLTIVLYGRPNCHLCDEAEALLLERQPRFGFQMKKLNIEDDPQWIINFGEWIPVAEIEGKIRFRGRIDEQLLDRLLENYCAGGGGDSPPEPSRAL